MQKSIILTVLMSFGRELFELICLDASLVILIYSTYLVVMDFENSLRNKYEYFFQRKL